MEAELERWRRGEKVSSEEQISVDMEKSMVSSVVEGNGSLSRGSVALLHHPELPPSCWFSLALTSTISQLPLCIIAKSSAAFLNSSAILILFLDYLLTIK